MNAELLALIEMARKLPPMTAREMYFQRISFAYGNVKMSNDTITRADIEREAELLYGPPPEK